MSHDIFVLSCSRAQLNPTCNTLQINTNSSGFPHIYTRKVLLPHSKHYYQHPIYFPLCNTDFKSVRFMLHALLLDYIYTSKHIENIPPTAPQTDARARRRHWRFPLNIHELPWWRVSRHVWEWPRKPYGHHYLAPIVHMQQMSHMYNAQSWGSWKPCDMDLSDNCSLYGRKSEVCDKYIYHNSPNLSERMEFLNAKKKYKRSIKVFKNNLKT